MELNFTVIYSQRKKLAITVERDRSVVVHAPIGTDPSKISQVVESRKQWIYEKTRHAQKYEGPPTAPGKELVNGESLLYLGRQYRIEILLAALRGWAQSLRPPPSAGFRARSGRRR